MTRVSKDDPYTSNYPDFFYHSKVKYCFSDFAVNAMKRPDKLPGIQTCKFGERCRNQHVRPDFVLKPDISGAFCEVTNKLTCLSFLLVFYCSILNIFFFLFAQTIEPTFTVKDKDDQKFKYCMLHHSKGGCPYHLHGLHEIPKVYHPLETGKLYEKVNDEKTFSYIDRMIRLMEEKGLEKNNEIDKFYHEIADRVDQNATLEMERAFGAFKQRDLEVLMLKQATSDYLKNVKRTLFSVDLVIVMDATSSMKKYLDEAKQKMAELIGRIRSEIPEGLVRVAFIA